MRRSHSRSYIGSAVLALGIVSLPSTGSADQDGQRISAGAKKVALAAPAPALRPAPERHLTEMDALVFTAPPRETPEIGHEVYQPIADYLSQVIGKKVVYQHPGTWGVYRTEMLRGGYDLIFDGPHFNSYRAEKLGHNILAKLPERHEFAVIVRKDQPFTKVQQMHGRTFCAHAPPNLGTLVLQAQFENPVRQPLILNTKGWEEIYNGVASGRCMGGVLPLANLKKYDKEGKTRVIFKAAEMPNQALSAGPRISPEDQLKIAKALVSPEATSATAKLRAAYKGGEHMVSTNNAEYTGLADFLRSEWGYY